MEKRQLKRRGKTQSKKLRDKSKGEEEKRKNKERSRDKSNENSKSEKIILNNIFQKNNSEFINKGLNLITISDSDSGIFAKYEEINRQAILQNSDGITEKINIMEINEEKTNKTDAQSLGQNLYSLIYNMKKTNNKYSFPILKFDQSLNDKEFMEIMQNSINYISGQMDNDYIKKIKAKLLNYENEIKNLFLNNKLIKDILENALITILTSEGTDIKEQENNLSLLTVDNISTCPLVNLPFTYNNNADINKHSIKETALSYIPFLSYKNALAKFTNKKITEESLNSNITNYINSHEFYFVNLKDDLNAITLHTGDVFINIKYLKEYFENINNNDNLLIIREKIMLVILHELNHGLLRIIDNEAYSNYLINSKRKTKKNNQIKYKGLISGEYYKLPIDETGNNFDYLLYAGYYFEYLDITIAKFFSNIAKYKNKKEYINDLDKCIKNMSHNITKVNKFKINYKKPRSQCAFSLFRNYRHEDKKKKINQKIENEDKDEIIEEDDIIDENEDGKDEDNGEME